MTATLPETAQPMFKLMISMLAHLNKQIAVFDREIRRRAKEDEAARRLMTIPRIGPVLRPLLSGACAADRDLPQGP